MTRAELIAQLKSEGTPLTLKAAEVIESYAETVSELAAIIKTLVERLERR